MRASGHGHRQRPWFYELDGSLNPTWLFVAIMFALGVAAVVAAIVIALATHDATALKFAFGFIALTLVVLLISALPRDRAKILANSQTVAAGLQSLGAVDRFFGGSAAHFDEPGGQDALVPPGT